MRVRKTFGLRTLLLVLTTLAIASSTVMTPVYAHIREQRALKHLPTQFRLEHEQFWIYT